ncbi:hypothetical protein ACTMU2_08180 [Cupriavidus basilensis]
MHLSEPVRFTDFRLRYRDAVDAVEFADDLDGIGDTLLEASGEEAGRHRLQRRRRAPRRADPRIA